PGEKGAHRPLAAPARQRPPHGQQDVLLQLAAHLRVGLVAAGDAPQHRSVLGQQRLELSVASQIHPPHRRPIRDRRHDERLRSRPGLSSTSATGARNEGMTAMTNDRQPAAARARPDLIRRGRGFFWLLSAVVGAAAVAAWGAVAVGYWLGVSRATWVILVVVAAVATEGLFWSVAAALGLSVLDARKRIWRWVTRRGLRA